ncbi:MAG: cation transporter [Acidobacteriaceae bacterium]|nr:cation transporter [Acidobacteriaceae bacterium]
MATLAYIVLLVVFGVRAHSLALLSEAGHNLSDFLALLLSWLAVYFQVLPPSSTKTYGYQRAGVLAAFVNALTLVIVALYIFYTAVQRLHAPVPVHATIMIVVAAAGMLMNGVITALLYGSSHDVNIRSAFLHMLGDTVSTAAVIVGGWAIAVTGLHWIDPALSIAIGLLILWSSWGIIRESLNILLEGMPRGMELERIAESIRTIAGVNDVHDLHVWSLGSDTHALSCHIGIADIPPSESEQILREVKALLKESFSIDHTTIQFEHVVCDTLHGCVVPVNAHNSHAHEN